MPQTSLDIRTTLYINALQSQSLHDRSLEGATLDIILASILAELSNPNSTVEDISRPPPQDAVDVVQKYSCFQKRELLMFGTPVRHHLNPSTRQCLLKEVKDVLSSIRGFLHGAQLCGTEEKDSFCTLPDEIQNLKDGIQSKQQEIDQQSQRIIDQILEISEIREMFERELKRAISTTFPTYDATRSASIDFLLTTIETTLIQLSLIRARTERAVYNHKPKNETKNSKTVSEALAVAFKSLKKEEMEMTTEALLLDQQLEEYETLVKCTGGYQQVVNDWTRIKQETDECKKDLRRLGWTGD